MDDEQVNDPSGTPRPQRILAKTDPGGAVLFDTQTYTYDGAGNIKKIGNDDLGYDSVSRLLYAETGCLDSGVTNCYSEAYTYGPDWLHC